MTNEVEITIRVVDQSREGYSRARRGADDFERHSSEALQRSQSRFGLLGTAAGVAGGLIKAGAAVGGVGLGLLSGFLIQGVKDARSYQVLAAKTAQVIKSTGNAAHISVKGIQELAGELEGISGVDEELIINSENVIATFTNIRNVGKNRIFDQATKSALDMSVALGTDLQNASIQVGKALNDPIKGVGALSRVGVTFTQGQKDMIKKLVETGDTMGAQKIILKELNKEFGGQAKAAGNTFEGAMARAKDAVSDAGRSIGTKLLPKLTAAADWLAKKIPEAIQSFSDGWNNAKLDEKGTIYKAGQLAKDIVEFFSKKLPDAITNFVDAYNGMNLDESEADAAATSLSGIQTGLEDVTTAFGGTKGGTVTWGKVFSFVADRIMEEVNGLLNAIGSIGSIVGTVVLQFREGFTQIEIKVTESMIAIDHQLGKLPGSMGKHFRDAEKQAKEELRKLQESLDGIRTKKAEQEVRDLQQKLKNLGRQKPSPKVDVETAKAKQRIRELTARLRGIKDQYVNVFISEIRRDEAMARRGPGKASGGYYGMGAASGGIRNSMTMVGEYGRELVDLSSGRVYNHGETEKMMAGGGGNGTQRIELEWVGGQAGDDLFKWIRKNIRVRGGNVQTVLGVS